MGLFTSQLDNSDEDYKRELLQQQISVQAHQEFASGKKCFEDAFDDGMDPALVDAAIDCFKRARKLVYDKDYELEAMAEAYLGNIYYKAHKNKTIARPHLYDAIRLANLVARSFTTEEWFNRATQQLAEI